METNWFISYKYGHVFGNMIVAVDELTNPNVDTIQFVRKVSDLIKYRHKDGILSDNPKPIILFYKRAY